MTARVLCIAALLIAAVASPDAAHALDMEYYTYNGFTAVSMAWEKIALIFSDSNYMSLFFVTMTMGIFFAATATIFTLLRSGRGSIFGWVWPIGMGMMIVMALIVPKGSLTIYDPVLNQFQTVNGIPNGVVALAGSLNKIERIVVEITNTSGGVQSYKDNAGGLGFQVLAQATGSAPPLGDEFFMQTLDQYNEKCLMFELLRPGTILTIEKIKNQSTDFTQDWAEAANPAIFTIQYSQADPTGTAVTCADAWQTIQSSLNNPANQANALKAACSGAGFNPDNPAELQRCQDLMGSSVDFIHDTSGYSAQNFIRQAGMAKALEYTLLRLSPDMATVAQANQSMMTSGIGMMIQANQWMPAARATFTAVAVCLIPFICLFIPTGVFNKALSIVIGFFVWLTAWGIIDATIHSVASTIAQREFETIRQHAMGYTAIMLYPDATLKALAMFGMVRSAGIMLATVITGMFVYFGGHALAMLAGNITGQMQAAGAAAARTANTLEGAAAADEAWRSSIPTMANAGRFSFTADTTARTAMRLGQTGGAIEAVNSMGGADTAASAIGKSTAADLVGRTRAGEGRHDAGLGEYGEKEYATGRSGVEGFQRFKDEIGTSNVIEAMTTSSAGGMVRGVQSGRAAMSMLDSYGGGLEGAERWAKGTASSEQLSLATAEARMAAVGGVEGQKKLTATQVHQELGGQAGFRDLAKALYGDGGDAGVQKLSTLMSRGRILDQEAVSHLERQGIKGLEAGMRVDGGTTGDGRLSFLAAEKQDGSGGVYFKDGMRVTKGVDAAGHAYEKIYSRDGDLVWQMDKSGVYGKTVMGADQLSEIARDPQASKYVRSMASQAADYARRSGGAMAVEFTKGTDGKWASITAIGGGSATLQSVARDLDFSERQHGRFVKDGTFVETGTRIQAFDVNTREIKHGLVLGDTAQMAMNRDAAMYRPIFDARTDEAREAAFTALSAKLGQDISPYWAREGIERTASKADAGAGVSMPGLSPVKASLSSGISAESLDQGRKNLAVAEINQRLHAAYTRFKDSSMSTDGRAAAMADEMGGFISSRINEGAGQTPQNFGASAHPVVKGVRSTAEDIGPDSMIGLGGL